MTFATLAPATLIAVLAATAATAQGTTPAASDLFAPLVAQGYQILDADAEGAWFEVDAITADGRRVELIVDAATGAIVMEQPDD